ncbi:hypothetical protein HII36_23160 [Nonomuraea sp. NN258]|uniref:hypothetical protein n=1 Tax=Nonomuraea antri TaxID=2730852 RepID=UPI001568A0D6|nr:hypothetical protein [Nonomuraea antri]NRQ34709.1 hypothetical protein [Nonomuraea antri]
MSADTVTAICATVIAVISLAVSIYQVRSSQRHNRYALRPLLQIWVAFVPGREAGLKIWNVGLGPAVVTSTEVWLDGQYIGPWTKGTSRLVRTGFTPRPRAHTLVEGTSIPIGDKAFLIGLDNYTPAEHVAYRELIEDRLDIRIRYKSLYGEAFVVSTRSVTQAPEIDFGRPFRLESQLQQAPDPAEESPDGDEPIDNATRHR